MPRSKKDGNYLNIKLDRQLYERLENACEIGGQTKTTLVERAKDVYLDDFEKKQETLRRIEEGSLAIVERTKVKREIAR